MTHFGEDTHRHSKSRPIRRTAYFWPNSSRGSSGRLSRSLDVRPPDCGASFRIDRASLSRLACTHGIPGNPSRKRRRAHRRAGSCFPSGRRARRRRVFAARCTACRQGCAARCSGDKSGGNNRHAENETDERASEYLRYAINIPCARAHTRAPEHVYDAFVFCYAPGAFMVTRIVGRISFHAKLSSVILKGVKGNLVAFSFLRCHI